MDELWKYYKEENWRYFLSNVVSVEFEKNKLFYENIKSSNLFPDDIFLVLATLSNFMFEGKIAEYENWLKKNQPMLGGYTPTEVIGEPNGINWLKEYLLRYPKI
jgi:hypothetical protein